MALRLGGGELHRHHVEEWWVALWHGAQREISSDVKAQLVACDRQGAPAVQWSLGAAIAVGGGAHDDAPLAVGGRLQELDRHAGGGIAAMGVEYMGRKTPMHRQTIGGFDALIEPQRNNAKDLG